jgi:alpha-tubulin suppressor-like RCC1 family protein
MGIGIDGSLWGWGWNSMGQLGNGSRENRPIPSQIGNDKDWRYVSVGDGHTIAIREDGSLWAWGSKAAEGVGILVNYGSIPVRIGADYNWVFVSASNRSWAIREDDSGNRTLWAWGCNYDKRLGDGTSINRLYPVQIGENTSWAYVSAGSWRTAAIATDGVLWVWGWNNAGGQLGDGTTDVQHSPVRVNTPYSDWATVSVGRSHTLAIREDYLGNRTLWAWGENSGGELGDGTTTSRGDLTQIREDTDWKSVSTGIHHTVALKTDGSLWAWGMNHFGQLGDGTGGTIHDFRNSPFRVNTQYTDWVYVSAGNIHSFAIRKDGSLWAWGSNLNRQLGLSTGGGTRDNRLSPIRITQ